jgi:hypothetical protein
VSNLDGGMNLRMLDGILGVGRSILVCRIEERRRGSLVDPVRGLMYRIV